MFETHHSGVECLGWNAVFCVVSHSFPLTLIFVRLRGLCS